MSIPSTRITHLLSINTNTHIIYKCNLIVSTIKRAWGLAPEVHPCAFSIPIGTLYKGLSWMTFYINRGQGGLWPFEWYESWHLYWCTCFNPPVPMLETLSHSCVWYLGLEQDIKTVEWEQVPWHESYILHLWWFKHYMYCILGLV